MNRLFVRITIGVMLALLLIMAALSTIVQYAIDRQWSQNLPPHGTFTISALEALLDERSDAERALILADLQERTGCPVGIVVLGDDDTLTPEVREAIRAGRTAWRREGHNGTLFTPLDGGSAALVIGPHHWGPALEFWTILLIVLVSLTVVTATGFALTYPVARRLKRLEVAAARITAGELHARAADDSNDPIGTLAKQFNEMAARNQGLLEQQRQMLQAVSHELRTPTARIRFSLEMLAEDRSPEAAEARLRSIDDDLLEIDELVHELLLYNRFDAVEPLLFLEDIDICKLTQKCMDKARLLCPDIAITLSAPEAQWLAVDKRAFKRVIDNLLSNALRYAVEHVEVSIEARSEMVIVQVSDDGPGIPEGHHQRVLQPFACLDESRNRKSSGAGLGLAIVERIMTAHQGHITITRSALGGAGVATHWPCKA